MQYFINPIFLPDLSDLDIPFIPDSNSSYEAEEETALTVTRSIRFLFVIVQFVNIYYIPSLVFVGICLNSLLLTVCLRQTMAEDSSSPYLASLAVSDNIFLVCLFIVWSTFSGLTNVYELDGWCLTITYASGVTAFLAPWIHVAISIDRFLFVQFGSVNRPTTLQRTSPIRSKVVCLAFLLVAVPVYLNVVLLYGTLEIPRYGWLCAPLPNFIPVIQVRIFIQLGL